MTGSPDAAWLIEHFGMSMLPIEGTYFVSTHRTRARTPDGYHAGTAIIGLLSAVPPSRSLFHRLPHDEVWHFYQGDPVRLVMLHPDGSDEEVVLGPSLATGNRVQQVVPAGTWQAAELVTGGTWALFGCTVAPGSPVSSSKPATPGSSRPGTRIGPPTSPDWA